MIIMVFVCFAIYPINHMKGIVACSGYTFTHFPCGLFVLLLYLFRRFRVTHSCNSKVASVARDSLSFHAHAKQTQVPVTP